MDDSSIFLIENPAGFHCLIRFRIPQRELMNLRQAQDILFLNLHDFKRPLLGLAGNPGTFALMAKIGAILCRKGKMKGTAHTGFTSHLRECPQGYLPLPQRSPIRLANEPPIVADRIVGSDSIMAKLRCQHAIVTSCDHSELVACFPPLPDACRIFLGNSIFTEQSSIIITGGNLHFLPSFFCSFQ